MTYKSVNPNNGKTLKTFDDLSDAQLEKALANAESCYTTMGIQQFVNKKLVRMNSVSAPV